VDALAQEYGFKPVFFWQPMLAIGDKPLTDEEQEMKRGLDPALLELYESIYNRVQQAFKKYENLHYMAKIFDAYEPLVWIDEAHVTPEGNQLIAQAMVQIFMDRNP
jgi:hypothetical protein